MVNNINYINNVTLATSIYQQGVVLLLAKTCTNSLLHQVINSFLTRFITENIALCINENNFLSSTAEDSFNIQHQISEYNKQVMDIWPYQSWYSYSTTAIRQLYKNNASVSTAELLQEHSSVLDRIYHYYNHHTFALFTAIDHGFNEKKHNKYATTQFIWSEFSKICNPKNIPITNKEVVKAMYETSCTNLVEGAKRFLDDVIRSPDGYFIINTVDTSAFEVGKNIAATKGKVIYQNKLMQLICYESTTEQVYKTPILIVTAWINKYYVLDLDPQYSFVKWLVDNGYKVFMISWVNPDARMKDFALEDYMKEGVVTALQQVAEISNSENVNCIGYCMGGTLLAISAAYLVTKQIHLINSLTLLTTLVDFEDCGTIKIFINDEIVNAIEHHMKTYGYLDGTAMFSAFSALKSSEMIWYYFINKYLMGKNPAALDVLYWNADSTRIPYKVHIQCLRDLYQKNLLSKKQLILDGVLIDLSNIKCPTYIFASHDDHIAPWCGIYSNMKLYGSHNKRFVLGQSGHVAAVINHPLKNKYGYWANKQDSKNKKLQDKNNTLNLSTDEWLKQAEHKNGSWWTDWHTWMTQNNMNNCKIDVQNIQSSIVIEDAPGMYVKMK